MRQFEIQTPDLRHAIEACRGVISGRQEGTMERDEARDITAAARGIISAVGQELKVRTAMPKIAAMEARMIEADRQDRRKSLEAAG